MSEGDDEIESYQIGRKDALMSAAAAGIMFLVVLGAVLLSRREDRQPFDQQGLMVAVKIK